MNRKTFVQQLSVLSAGVYINTGSLIPATPVPSDFSKHLQPAGRALELENYYVWCNSPILGTDGKTHVLFSRWNANKKMSGWINGSEIAHAVADQPEGPYRVLDTVLQPRPGYWDATTCHNPFITSFNNKYYLYYMGNANGKTNTKRIGLAVADALEGPWTRMDQPLLEPGPEGAWDDHCTTNPVVLRHPDGRYWLYYKSWNTNDYETQTGAVRGNRKYGLAFSNRPEGPFKKYEHNPVVDFSKRGNNAQLEDAFVWHQGNRFYMIARDMGYYNHEYGIILSSRNGLAWGTPKIAFYGADRYIQQPPAPAHLKRYGRFERPQLLIRNGKPTHLFTTSQGGRYGTASSFIFKIT